MSSVIVKAINRILNLSRDCAEHRGTEASGTEWLGLPELAETAIYHNIPSPWYLSIWFHTFRHCLRSLTIIA